MDINKILKIAKEDRKTQQINFQKSFEKLRTPFERFEYIYMLFYLTQKDFLKFKNKENDLFGRESYKNLVKKLKRIKNLNTDSLLEFINEELIKPIGSAHIFFTRDETVLSKKEIKDRKEELEEKKKDLEENIEYEIIDDKLILKIRSFKRKYLDQAKSKFNELEEKLKNIDIKNVILDIRGNQDGTDEYFKYLSMFANRNIVENNKWQDLILSKNYEIEEILIPKGTEKKYNMYLLVDGNVFSAADTLARVCKNTGFAKVVGETTLGGGCGLTISNIKIKRVKEKVEKIKGYTEYEIELGDSYLYFSTDAPIDKNGRIDYENLYNTKPDIECLGEDALEYALKDIKKQREKLEIEL